MDLKGILFTLCVMSCFISAATAQKPGKCGGVCKIGCPFGNVLDYRGCPICKCKTGCKNEAQPSSVWCQDGVRRCPGAFTCVEPKPGRRGVCCPFT